MWNHLPSPAGKPLFPASANGGHSRVIADGKVEPIEEKNFC
jgi:hypothetical protein